MHEKPLCQNRKNKFLQNTKNVQSAETNFHKIFVPHGKSPLAISNCNWTDVKKMLVTLLLQIAVEIANHILFLYK